MTSAADLSPHFARLGGDPLLDAFETRRAVMPWRSTKPLPDEEVAGIWDRITGEPVADAGPARPRLAYLHVPFCANHCLFCGFYRNAYTPQAASAYAQMVAAEIEADAQRPGVWQQPVEAVYLGGGTPSALSASELSHLVRTLRRHLPLTPDCEITLEGRIIHFDPEKVDACMDAGVNRISIGVQTFDTKVRRRQGRRSSKEESIAFIESLRDRDRAAIVIDLIYGLPGQTDEVWAEDLRIAAGIGPDGVDLYGLNMIPGTPLFKAMQAGKFDGAPTLRDRGRMYRIGAEYLAEQGWEHISNSHWRLTPRERNRYNLRIKQGAECLAYGSGAGGSLGPYSYFVAPDLEDHAQGVREGRKPVAGMRVADAQQPLRDLVTGSIESGRIDLDRIEAAAPAPGTKARVTPLLEQWQQAGLVGIEGNVATLTLAGRFWYSNLVVAFDAVLCEDGAPASGRGTMPPMPPSSMNPHKSRQMS